MSARAVVWRWNRRMLRGERRQLLAITALLALAVGAGVAAVLGAYNLAPPPEQRAGGRYARATVVGDASDQTAAFAAAFDDVGVIESASVAIPGSTRRPEVRTTAEDGPAANDLISVIDGRWPNGEEVAITSALATELGTAVGSTVDLGAGPQPVVATIENPTDLDDDFVLAGDLAPLDVAPADVTTVFLIDAPQGAIDAAAVGSLSVETSSYGLPEARTAAAVGVSVVAGLALLQVTLLAAAGFAIVNQRRTRQYGLLAATGAGPRQILWAAAIPGLSVGLLASAVGVTAAVVGVGLVVPDMEDLVRHRIDLALPWWATVPTVLLAVAAATVASAWPVRALARQPVAATLAARRPSARPARHLAAPGFGLVAAGTAGLLWSVGAGAAGFASLAVIATVVGVVLLTPAAASTMGRVAKPLPLAARLAGRHLARRRGRSAAVIAAMVVALAAATAVASVTAAVDAREGAQPPNLPDNVALISLDVPIEPALVIPAEIDPVAAARAEEVVAQAASDAGDLAVVPIEVAVPGGGDRLPAEFAQAGPASGVMTEVLLQATEGRSGEVFSFGEVDADGNEVRYAPHALWLGTDEMLAAWELPADAFDEGAAVLAPWDDAILFGDRGRGGDAVAVRATPDAPGYGSIAPAFIDPSALDALDLTATTVGWLVIDDAPLSDEDRAALHADVAGVGVVELQQPPASAARFGTIATLAAVAVALIIVMTAVGLTRMESAGEVRMLVALGATQRIGRRIVAATAVLLALAAAALALPLGFLAQLAVVASPASDLSVSIPWTTVAAIGLLLPLSAGALATLGGARMGDARRLAADGS